MKNLKKMKVKKIEDFQKSHYENLIMILKNETSITSLTS